MLLVPRFGGGWPNIWRISGCNNILVSTCVYLEQTSVNTVRNTVWRYEDMWKHSCSVQPPHKKSNNTSSFLSKSPSSMQKIGPLMTRGTIQFLRCGLSFAAAGVSKNFQLSGRNVVQETTVLDVLDKSPCHCSWNDALDWVSWCSCSWWHRWRCRINHTVMETCCPIVTNPVC